MKKKLIVGFALLLCLVTLPACGSNKLNGSYQAKINLFLVEGTDTLKFKDDKVTEIDSNGETINKGTYTIKDNVLKIKIGKYHMKAKLADDHNSFTVTSADGLVDLISGTKYKLKN